MAGNFAASQVEKSQAIATGQATARPAPSYNKQAYMSSLRSAAARRKEQEYKQNAIDYFNGSEQNYDTTSKWTEEANGNVAAAQANGNKQDEDFWRSVAEVGNARLPYDDQARKQENRGQKAANDEAIAKLSQQIKDLGRSAGIMAGDFAGEAYRSLQQALGQVKALKADNDRLDEELKSWGGELVQTPESQQRAEILANPQLLDADYDAMLADANETYDRLEEILDQSDEELAKQYTPEQIAEMEEQFQQAADVIRGGSQGGYWGWRNQTVGEIAAEQDAFNEQFNGGRIADQPLENLEFVTGAALNNFVGSTMNAAGQALVTAGGEVDRAKGLQSQQPDAVILTKDERRFMELRDKGERTPEEEDEFFQLSLDMTPDNLRNIDRYDVSQVATEKTGVTSPAPEGTSASDLRGEQIAERRAARGTSESGTPDSTNLLTRLGEDVQDAADTAIGTGQEYLNDALRGKGKAGQLAVKAGYTIGQMLGDAASGQGLKMMAARVFGETSAAARQQGATLSEQNLYGLSHAAIETATEHMFGVFGAYGKGFSDDFAESVVNNLARSEYGAMAIRFILSGVEEGSEEIASAFLDPIAENILSHKGEYNIDMADMAESAIIGAFLGLVGGGGQIVSGQSAAMNAQGLAGMQSQVDAMYNAMYEEDQAPTADDLATLERLSTRLDSKMTLAEYTELVERGMLPPGKASQYVIGMGKSKADVHSPSAAARDAQEELAETKARKKAERAQTEAEQMRGYMRRHGESNYAMPTGEDLSDISEDPGDKPKENELEVGGKPYVPKPSPARQGKTEKTEITSETQVNTKAAPKEAPAPAEQTGKAKVILSQAETGVGALTDLYASDPEGFKAGFKELTGYDFDDMDAAGEIRELHNRFQGGEFDAAPAQAEEAPEAPVEPVKDNKAEEKTAQPAEEVEEAEETDSVLTERKNREKALQLAKEYVESEDREKLSELEAFAKEHGYEITDTDDGVMVDDEPVRRSTPKEDAEAATPTETPLSASEVESGENTPAAKENAVKPQESAPESEAVQEITEEEATEEVKPRSKAATAVVEAAKNGLHSLNMLFNTDSKAFAEGYKEITGEEFTAEKVQQFIKDAQDGKYDTKAQKALAEQKAGKARYQSFRQKAERGEYAVAEIETLLSDKQAKAAIAKAVGVGDRSGTARIITAYKEHLAQIKARENQETKVWPKPKEGNIYETQIAKWVQQGRDVVANKLTKAITSGRSTGETGYLRALENITGSKINMYSDNSALIQSIKNAINPFVAADGTMSVSSEEVASPKVETPAEPSTKTAPVETKPKVDTTPAKEVKSERPKLNLVAEENRKAPPVELDEDAQQLFDALVNSDMTAKQIYSTFMSDNDGLKLFNRLTGYDVGGDGYVLEKNEIIATIKDAIEEFRGEGIPSGYGEMFSIFDEGGLRNEQRNIYGGTQQRGNRSNNSSDGEGLAGSVAGRMGRLEGASEQNSQEKLPEWLEGLGKRNRAVRAYTRVSQEAYDAGSVALDDANFGELTNSLVSRFKYHTRIFLGGEQTVWTGKAAVDARKAGVFVRSYSGNKKAGKTIAHEQGHIALAEAKDSRVGLRLATYLYDSIAGLDGNIRPKLERARNYLRTVWAKEYLTRYLPDWKVEKFNSIPTYNIQAKNAFINNNLGAEDLVDFEERINDEVLQELFSGNDYRFKAFLSPEQFTRLKNSVRQMYIANEIISADVIADHDGMTFDEFLDAVSEELNQQAANITTVANQNIAARSNAERGEALSVSEEEQQAELPREKPVPGPSTKTRSREVSSRATSGMITEAGGMSHEIISDAENERVARVNYERFKYRHEVDYLTNRGADALTADERKEAAIILGDITDELGHRWSHDQHRANKELPRDFDTLTADRDALIKLVHASGTKASGELRARTEMDDGQTVRKNGMDKWIGDREPGKVPQDDLGRGMYRIIDDLTRYVDNIKDGDTQAVANLIRHVDYVRGSSRLLGKDGAKITDAAIERILRDDPNAFKTLKKMAYGSINGINTDFDHVRPLESVKHFRYLALLSNPATKASNLGNNAGSITQNAAAQNIGTKLFGRTAEKLTGKKYFKDYSNALLFTKRGKQNIDAATLDMAKSWLSLYYGLDVDFSGLDTNIDYRNKARYNMNGSAFERWMARWSFISGLGMQTSDTAQIALTREGIKQGYANESLSEEERTELDEEAQTEAARRMHHEETKAAKTIQSLRNTLNKAKVGNDRVGTIGLGDIRLPFINVPLNVGIKAAKGTTLGTIASLGRFGYDWTRAYKMYQAVQDRASLEQIANQREFTDAEAKRYEQVKDAELMSASEMQKAIRRLGLGVTNAALIGLGALAAACGGLRDFDYDDDDDTVRLAKEQGFTGLQINLSKLFSRHRDWEPDKDIIIGGAWLEILSVPLKCGYHLHQELKQTDGNWLKVAGALGSSSWKSIADAIDALQNIPGVSDAAKIIEHYENIKRYDTSEQPAAVVSAISQQTASDVASFVPNVVAQFAKGKDNTQRDIYNSNLTVKDQAQTMGYIMASKIPWLRENVIPAKLDSFGETMTYADTKLGALINSMLLPGDVRVYREHELATEYKRLSDAGYQNVAAKKSPPKEIQIGEETFSLDKADQDEYDQTYSRLVAQRHLEAINSDAYKNLDDAGKQFVLRSLRAWSERETKQAILGDRADVSFDKWETELDSLDAQLNFLAAKYTAKTIIGMEDTDSDGNSTDKWNRMDEFLNGDYAALGDKERRLLNNSFSYLDDMHEALTQYKIPSETFQTARDVSAKYNEVDENGKKIYKSDLANSTRMWDEISRATGYKPGSRQMDYLENKMQLSFIGHPNKTGVDELIDVGFDYNKASRIYDGQSKLKVQDGYSDLQMNQKYIDLDISLSNEKDKFEAWFTMVSSSSTKQIKNMRTYYENWKKTGIGSYREALRKVGVNKIYTKTLNSKGKWDKVLVQSY